MRNECNIIQDLLPLYAEHMVSEDSAELVREHLSRCEACQAQLAMMQVPLAPSMPTIEDKRPLKAVKRKLYQKKIQTVLLTAVLVLAAAAAAIAYLTAPNYIRYTDSLLSVSGNADGSVIVTFSGQVTGCQLSRKNVPESGRAIYHIEAWSTLWDRLFLQKGTQSLLIGPDADLPIAVYFTQNHTQASPAAEDVLIYGEEAGNSGGSVTLPGLSLGPWLAAGAVLSALGGLLWLICWRRDRLAAWIQRITCLPLSYVIAHICVLGFSTVSYSEQRDLSAIALIGLFICCALLMGGNLYRLHKEQQALEHGQ